MWTSIQNGRKKDDSVDKIKQYIKLTDKSSFSSKLSKSTVGIIRSESTQKKHEYCMFYTANRISYSAMKTCKTKSKAF